MPDPILEIGQAGLETADENIKSVINRMVNGLTPGFKKSEVVVRSFPLELDAAQKKIQAEAPRVDDTYYDYSKGALNYTGGNTDFALGSEGFFVVQAPWGEGYTRDGRFIISSNGNMVSVAGQYPLLGQGGPIYIPQGAKVTLSQTGEIIVDGKVVDTLRAVSFDKLSSLDSVNGSVFKNTSFKANQIEVPNPRFLQGYVEASNVNSVDQVMSLITINRQYTANTKAVQTRDGNLTKAMDMGRMQ